jgi:hypothetical protein
VICFDKFISSRYTPKIVRFFRDGHQKTTEGDGFIINSDNKDVICDWRPLFVIMSAAAQAKADGYRE